MEEETFTCNECAVEFTLVYDAIEQPQVCPFCASPLEEDLVDLEEEWDENPNPYGDSDD